MIRRDVERILQEYFEIFDESRPKGKNGGEFLGDNECYVSISRVC